MYRLKRSIVSYKLMNLAFIILVINYLCYRLFALDGIKNILRITAVLLVICSAWFDGLEKIKLNKIDLLSIFGGGLAFILSRFSTLNFIVILIIIICTKKYTMKEFIQMCSLANLVGFGIYIIGCISGNIVWKAHIVGDRIRNTLGFNNVNAAAIFFFSMVVLWILRKPDKFRFFTGSLFMGWVYFMTDSRTTVVGYLLFICVYTFYYLLKYFPRCKNLFHRVVKNIWGIFIIVSASIIFLMESLVKMFPNLDRLLSNRLSITKFVMDNLSLKVFLLGGSSVEIDNPYVNILCSGGVFLFLFIVILIAYVIYKNKNYESNDIGILSIVYAVIAMGIMESLWLRPEILVSLVFWKYIYDVAGKEFRK